MFTLTVSTEARSASIAQQIQVVADAIPVVTFVWIKPSAKVGTINADDMLVVGAHTNEDVTWNWAISPSLDLGNGAVAPLGTNQAVFVLMPGLLPTGARYTLTVTATKSPGVQGVAQQDVYVNLPSSSGACSVTPSVGTSLDTEFTASCTGWVDDGVGSLFYSFAYVDDASGELVQLQARSRANSKPNFVLPAPVSGSGEITVMATVADSLGATTTSKMKVSVTDAFAGLGFGALIGSVANLMNNQLDQAKKKGDAGGALNLLSNSAQLVSGGAISARRRLVGGSEANLGQSMLNDLVSISASTVISAPAGTLEAVAGCLRKVTLLSDTLGVPHNVSDTGNDLFTSLDLLSLCAKKNAGAQMGTDVATHFVLV